MNPSHVISRAKCKFRNERMIQARAAKGMSQTALAVAAGVSLREVIGFEAMRYQMPDVEGKAVRVSVALGLPTDDVMPPDRRQGRIPRVVVEEIRTRLTLPDPLDTVSLIITRDKIHQLLQTITYREREIVKLRYGVGVRDGYTYTLEEVGRIFKMTRGRVREVEAKAIRKLRHPVRARNLAPFYRDLKQG